MSAINWKSTGNRSGESWCIIRGTMCMKIQTVEGPLYYTAAVPGIQYTNEGDLLRFLDRKHRAA